MPVLISGLVLFLGIHSAAIVAPGWRDAMAARFGNGWRAAYSIVALAGLVLIVIGYGDARQAPIVLYTPPVTLRWVALVLLAFVFPLLLSAYLPGRIRAAAKHPMLVATKAWAVAHLLANGTAADLLLFGGLLAWAVADRISLKRRAPRETLALPATPLNDAIAVGGGLLIYWLFLRWLHDWLVGMPIVVPPIF